MTRARDLADYISTGVSDTELDVLDGVTAGTVTASKALVVDANKDISSLRNITATGTITGTVSTAAQTNITSLGTLTALTVDDITINGSTISDGGDLTLDVAGDIHLDSDNGVVRFKDGGTEFGQVYKSANDIVFYSSVANSDVFLSGNDGSNIVNGLSLDFGSSGAATFYSTVTANAGVVVDNITIDGTEIDLSSGDLTVDVAGNIVLDADGGGIYFKDAGTTVGFFQNDGGDFRMISSTSDKDIKFLGNDGGSTITALTLDMSEAGKATFNSDVVAPRFVDSDNSGYYVDPYATSVLAYAYLQQSYGFNTALSGTTPTINAGQFNSFSLTTSGNTTFTFSVNGVSTGYLIGFVLKLTAGGGHTITYPNTVDFAGGTAPDAPASGETDILVFTTIDAGTTWYGTRAIDAAA